MSDISDYLQTTSTLSRADLNKILEALQQIRPKIEQDAGKEFVAVSNALRKRTLSVTRSDGPHESITTTDRLRETIHFKRKKPLTVNSYPLVHTTTGTLTFPTAGHKLGGNGVFSGSSYITVTDQTRLNITDEISVGLWIKPPTASADGLIFSKNNQYQLKLQATNQIAWRTYSGGAWRTALTYTYTPGSWIHVMASYKSTSSGQKLYINGTLNSSDGLTGALGTSVNDLKIGGDGTSNVPNTTAFSWLTALHKEVSSGWVTDFQANNLIDTSGTNIEIMTIPFLGTEEPQPDATSGLCRST